MIFTIPDNLRSWHLDRMSPNSDVHSVTLHTKKFISASEMETIRGLITGGDCYRFRIGNARYYFGSTPQEAIDRAIVNDAETIQVEA